MSGLGDIARELQEGVYAQMDSASKKQTTGRIDLSGIRPSDDKYASKMRAGIALNEWDDYITKFAPYEDKLVGFLGNEQNKDRLLSRAGENVSTSMGLADMATARMRGNTGAVQTARQRQLSDQARAMTKTAVSASMKNNLRQQIKDTDMNILAGGLSSITQRPEG